MDLEKFDLITDSYVKSQILFTSIEVGIFDCLQEKNKTAKQVANNLECDYKSIKRLLKWLIHLDLLELNDKKFILTSFSQKYLTKSSKDNILKYINSSKNFRDELWNNLTKAVKTGQEQWSNKNAKMWDKFYNNKKELQIVIDSFENRTKELGNEISKKIIFKKNSTIIDIGGGSGIVVSKIIQKNNSCKGIVIDNKKTIDITQNKYSNINYLDVDFTNKNLPSGDYFILSWILHDWDNKTINKILKKCKKNLNKGGKIIICEILPNKKGFSNWDIMDGHMLVSTKGRERNLKEYVSLLNKFGFTLEKKYPTTESRTIMVFN